jgi:ParB-like nuclease domain
MTSMLAPTAERRAVEAPPVDLRIVPIDCLVPHEEHDHQRAEPLVKRIREAGSWLNPPIVAALDAQRFVILDGANRHYALSHLGYAYILVQVVEYESEHVRLDTWNHVVSGLSAADFLRNLASVAALQVERTDMLSARVAVARREVLSYAVLGDDLAYTLNTREVHATGRTFALRQIVDTYKRSGTLNRINTDVLARAHRDFPNATAIVVFPHFQPAEILVAARDGVLLPPGISRHVIQGRAMRLHYPLEAFRADGESLHAKNERLQGWVQERNAQKRVRFYAESSYLFDE